MRSVWMKARLTVPIFAAAIALAVAGATVLAQSPGTPSPQQQEGQEQEQPSQQVAVTGLATVGGSGFVGSAVLVGSAQAQQQGTPQPGQGQALLALTLIDNGGGLFSPGPDDIGNAVLLNGTCETPTGVAQDLGPLYRVSAFGVLPVQSGQGGPDATPWPAPQATPSPDITADAPPAWTLVIPLPMGMQQLTQGNLAVAILDNGIEPATLMGQPTPEQLTEIADSELACGQIGPGAMLMPGQGPNAPYRPSGTITPTGTPTPGGTLPPLPAR
ncbi:MAG: hypothetical protein FJ318_10155 [SAR202 cluster bacterium]|nr:hypothetical protein [SAR202 cluster bacterium]